MLVPSAKLAKQVEPQLIPLGILVTVPLPVLVTVKIDVVEVSSNVAETDWSVFRTI